MHFFLATRNSFPHTAWIKRLQNEQFVRNLLCIYVHREQIKPMCSYGIFYYDCLKPLALIGNPSYITKYRRRHIIYLRAAAVLLPHERNYCLTICVAWESRLCVCVLIMYLFCLVSNHICNKSYICWVIISSNNNHFSSEYIHNIYWLVCFFYMHASDIWCGRYIYAFICLYIIISFVIIIIDERCLSVSHPEVVRKCFFPIDASCFAPTLYPSELSVLLSTFAR